MLADILSGALRALSFVLLFQAAGAALFVAAFGRTLTGALADIRRLGGIAALVGIAVILAHYSLDAARMAGELSGIVDLSLQHRVVTSASGTLLTFRVLGLLLVAWGLRGEGDFRIVAGVIGATLAVASFSLVGHTSVHPARSILAVLLMAHLLIVAFWFGALAPLYLVSARETSIVAGKVIDAFSQIALWLVPGILLAGLVLAAVLIPHFAVFKEPYGELLIAKLVGFAALMLLAAANKWRFGPAIARAEGRASMLFRRAVVAEFFLIVAVLAATAVMTAFFSPEH